MKVNPHGEKVISVIKAQCNKETGDYEPLENFVRMWRLAFLENMKPKYLPRGWNVEHKMHRTFGKLSVFNGEESGESGDGGSGQSQEEEEEAKE